MQFFFYFSVLDQQGVSIVIIINIYRHKNAICKGPQPLYHTEAVLNKYSVDKMTSGYMAVSFISIDRN